MKGSKPSFGLHMCADMIWNFGIWQNHERKAKKIIEKLISLLALISNILR